MKQLKKALAMFLCFAMCLSLFPTWAFAEGENGETAEVVEEAEITEVIPEEPVYEEPVYEEPVYEEPVYEEPVYEEPVYEEPVYEEPVNEEPVYEEPVNDEPAAEEPAAERTAAEEAVRVVFLFDETAEGASVRVYAKDENGPETDMTAEEDGSFLLLPGQYYYTAQAEGFVETGETGLTVEASEETLTVAVELELSDIGPAAAGEEIEPGVAEVLTGVGFDRYVPENDGISNEELLTKYAAQQLENALTGEHGIHPMSPADPTSGLNEAQIAAYEALKDCITETAAGERPSTVYEVEFSSEVVANYLTWTPATLPGGGYESFTTENLAAAVDQGSDNTLALGPIHTALLYSLPYELYWYDKTVGIMSACSYDYTMMTDGSISNVYITGMTYYLAVADAYWDGTSVVDKMKVGVKNVGSTITDAVATAQGVVDACSGYTDLGKLTEYKNWICEQVSYNSAAAKDDYDLGYGDPWQLIYAFDDDPDTNIVCEGYSKAFEYLCDLSTFSDSNIRCYLATGTMNGGTGAGAHMWNIVTMDDGRNYLVDVTNCDEGTAGAPDLLFLKGFESGSAAEGYVFAANNLSGSITYVYDSKTQGYYNTDELTLSDCDYGEAPTAFEELKAAVNSGASFYSLGRTTEITIAENLTIPAGMRVEGPNAVITVPSGVKLTVSGTLFFPGGQNGLVIASGGILEIGDGGSLEMRGAPYLTNVSGTLSVGNGRLYLSRGVWENPDGGLYRTNISVGEYGQIHVDGTVFDAESLEETMNRLAATTIPAGLSPAVSLDGYILFPWTLEEDYEFPNGINVNIRNNGDDESGSVTVPEGTELTVNGSFTLRGAEMTVNGSLVNNGEIHLRGGNGTGTGSSLTLDTGAACSGVGRVLVYADDAVSTVIDPEELLTQVSDEGFAAVYCLNNRLRADFTAEGWELLVPYGEQATLTVEVSCIDDTGLSYEWYDENGILEGETAETLTTAPVTGRKLYSCTVRDRYGNESATGFIDVGVDNELKAEPADGVTEISLPLGTSFTLSVEVSARDTEGLSYDWEKWGGDDSTEPVKNGTSLTDTVGGKTTYYFEVKDRFGNSAFVMFSVSVENHLSAFAAGTEETERTILLDPDETVTMAVDVSADTTDEMYYSWYRKTTYTNGWADKRIDYSYMDETIGTEMTSVPMASDIESIRYVFGAHDKYMNVAEVTFWLLPTPTVSGSCGDNASWSFDKDSGTLTITGSGAVPDYSYQFDPVSGEIVSDVPWQHLRAYIRRVVMEEGITAPGNNTLKGLDELRTVVLPATLQSIPQRMLQESPADEVVFGGTVAQWRAMEIPFPNGNLMAATVRCSDGIADMSSWSGSQTDWSLTDGTLTISGSGEIWDYAIEDGGVSPWYNSKDQVTSVVIAEGITKIGGDTFADMPNLTSVTIPEGVEVIGQGAFANAVKLEEVQLPKTLKTIEMYAFMGCRSLPEIVLWNGVETIGLMAFSGCENLTTVYIPESVTEIGGGAFSGSGLTTVYYAGTATQWTEISIGSDDGTLHGAQLITGSAPVVKLPAPTNVIWNQGWHGGQENGMAHFEYESDTKLDAVVSFYRDGVALPAEEEQWIAMVEQPEGSGKWRCHSAWFRFNSRDLESGSYTFTVKLVAEGCEDSDTVSSESWTYTRPDAEVPGPVVNGIVYTGEKVLEPDFTVTASEYNGSPKFVLEYRPDQDSEDILRKEFQLNGFDDPVTQAGTRMNETMRSDGFGEGWYRIGAAVNSNDITRARNSETVTGEWQFISAGQIAGTESATDRIFSRITQNLGTSSRQITMTWNASKETAAVGYRPGIAFSTDSSLLNAGAIERHEVDAWEWESYDTAAAGRSFDSLMDEFVPNQHYYWCAYLRVGETVTVVEEPQAFDSGDGKDFFTLKADGKSVGCGQDRDLKTPYTLTAGEKGFYTIETSSVTDELAVRGGDGGMILRETDSNRVRLFLDRGETVYLYIRDFDESFSVKATYSIPASADAIWASEPTEIGNTRVSFNLTLSVTEETAKKGYLYGVEASRYPNFVNEHGDADSWNWVQYREGPCYNDVIPFGNDDLVPGVTYYYRAILLGRPVSDDDDEVGSNEEWAEKYVEKTVHHFTTATGDEGIAELIPGTEVELGTDEHFSFRITFENAGVYALTAQGPEHVSINASDGSGLGGDNGKETYCLAFGVKAGETVYVSGRNHAENATLSVRPALGLVPALNGQDPISIQSGDVLSFTAAETGWYTVSIDNPQYGGLHVFNGETGEWQHVEGGALRQKYSEGDVAFFTCWYDESRGGMTVSLTPFAAPSENRISILSDGTAPDHGATWAEFRLKVVATEDAAAEGYYAALAFSTNPDELTWDQENGRPAGAELWTWELLHQMTDGTVVTRRLDQLVPGNTWYVQPVLLSRDGSVLAAGEVANISIPAADIKALQLDTQESLTRGEHAAYSFAGDSVDDGYYTLHAFGPEFISILSEDGKHVAGANAQENGSADYEIPFFVPAGKTAYLFTRAETDGAWIRISKGAGELDIPVSSEEEFQAVWQTSKTLESANIILNNLDITLSELPENYCIVINEGSSVTIAEGSPVNIDGWIAMEGGQLINNGTLNLNGGINWWHESENEFKNNGVLNVYGWMVSSSHDSDAKPAVTIDNQGTACIFSGTVEEQISFSPTDAFRYTSAGDIRLVLKSGDETIYSVTTEQQDARIAVLYSESGEEMESDLFIFSVLSEEDVLTVDPESGLLTPNTPGTAVVGVRFKANENAVASLTVNVVATESEIVIKAGEGDNVAFKDGIYVIERESTEIGSTALLVPAGDLKKGTYKYSSSDTKVATVAENTDGSATVTLKGVGEAAITVASAAKNGRLPTTVSVRVKDYTPRLAVSTVTLDPQLEGEVQIPLLESYGKVIGRVELTQSGGQSIPNVAYRYDSGMLSFSVAEGAADASYKNALLQAYDESGQVFGSPIQLNITVKKSALPAITVKQSGKFNLFYEDSTAILTVSAKGAEIEDIGFAEHGIYDPTWNYDGTVTVALKQGGYDLRAAAAPVTMNIKLAGYRAFTKDVKITSETKAPTLILSPAAGTIDTTRGNRTAQFTVSDKSTGAELDLTDASLTGTDSVKFAAFGINPDENAVTVTAVEQNGKYTGGTAKIGIQAQGWTQPVTVSYKLTVKTTAVTPKLKLGTTTLTLNSVFTDREARTTLATDLANVPVIGIDPYSVNYTGSAKSAAEAGKIHLWYDDRSGELVADVLDPSIALGSYKFSFVPISRIDDGTESLSAATVTVKVVNTLPKVSVASAGLKLNANYAYDIDFPNAATETARTAVKISDAAYRVVYFGYDSTNVSFEYDEESMILSASLVSKKANSDSVILTPWVEDIETGEVQPVAPITMKVTVITNTATVKLAASGSLDAVIRENGITYTPTLANLSGTITGVSLSGPDAGLFRVELGENSKGLTAALLYLQDDAQVSTKTTYQVQLDFTVNSGIEISSAPVKIKVKQSALKFNKTEIPTVFQSAGSSAATSFSISLAGPAGARIGSIAIDRSLTAVLKSAINTINWTIDGDTAVVTVTFRDASLLKSGSTHKIPLIVTPQGSADDAAIKTNAILSFRVSR